MLAQPRALLAPQSALLVQVLPALAPPVQVLLARVLPVQPPRVRRRKRQPQTRLSPRAAEATKTFPFSFVPS